MTRESYPMEWVTDERELDQEPVLREDKTVILRDEQTGLWRIERTTVRDHTVRRTEVARSSGTATFREARRVANNLSSAVYVRSDDRAAAEAELTGPPPAPVPAPTPVTPGKKATGG